MKKKTKTKKKRNPRKQKEEEENNGEGEVSAYPIFCLIFWCFSQRLFEVYFPIFIHLLYPICHPLLPPGLPPLLPRFLYPRILYRRRINHRSKNGKKSSKNNRKNREKKYREKKQKIKSHINTNNAAILSVNWTAGFMLSDFAKHRFNSSCFRKLLRLREIEYPNVPVCIHGLWFVLGRNGKNVRRPNFTQHDLATASDVLVVYLNQKPETLLYLDRYWPDLFGWSPTQWQSQPLNRQLISSKFEIILREYLLHGRPLGWTISEYVARTIEEFQRIRIDNIVGNITGFPQHTGKRFSMGYGSINSVQSRDLISDLEYYIGKRPSLSFMEYTSIYQASCILCEFKFKFSVTSNGEFILEDQPKDTKCNRHRGLPPNTSHTRHDCVVLSHHDRWTQLRH